MIMNMHLMNTRKMKKAHLALTLDCKYSSPMIFLSHFLNDKSYVIPAKVGIHRR